MNSQKLSTLTDDVKGVKKSLIAMLLDENPNKTELAKGLLASSALINGLHKFNSEKYTEAFEVWKSDAISGNEDSTFAIHAARKVLTKRIERSQKTTDKVKLQEILTQAPDISITNGKYELVEDNKTL
ncbi:MAG: hypothetical protein JAY85_19935 [Candidatus Thiodiazotropha weberae]|uniref:hypothetical protein n=1 Tax=Candidatus Thiodiazotropha endoloripes TaxID=1818881 RepID=UPI00083DF627|nr:hypothetical protein [Candidatus Thiodiazotropha endoloripes]MCG7900717.1 hypothetical protein [Candidatus Thiodiazotropha weberae]ODB87699.1 hypothetical protein A3193_01995 [Candidatus Thiodiazotropha endoloripes]ODB89947.1 hypothetical protein A3195_00060 [Candidatus Thiodiazotropha endoloripes]